MLQRTVWIVVFLALPPAAAPAATPAATTVERVSTVACVEPRTPTGESHALLDAFPAAMPRYDDGGAAVATVVREVVPGRHGPVEVLRRLTGPAGASGAGDGGRHHKYLPILLSALVPGAGEMYMGYEKRGAVLMLAEATAWIGYAYKNQQGLNTRSDYEHYADVHWDMNRWIQDHPAVYPNWTPDYTLADLEQEGRDSYSGNGAWPGYIPWVPRSQDKQHYYENIGKYDWYVSGWDDYTPGTFPSDLGPGQVFSLHRETYRQMRRTSNNQLDSADRFVYLSIVARVYSLVETTLLVNRSSNDTAERAARNHWSVSARSRGPSDSEFALEYHFK